MDANSASTLSERLRRRGLSVTERDDGTVTVTNPLCPLVGEIVATIDGSYRTDYGYEIGQHGDEPATADRIAHLLGVPRTSEAS